jgi:hypothetical protein
MGVLFTAFIVVLFTAGNLQGAGLISDPEAARVAVSLARPECSRIKESGSLFIIQQQSVPSASRVMCLSALPLGWEYRGLDARTGESKIILDSDRAGVAASSATLTETCDTSGATEVPSDEAGTRRFEDIDTFSERYSGRRYYTFDGGCVTYAFDFSGLGRTALAGEVTAALSFVEKTDLAEVYERELGEEYPF